MEIKLLSLSASPIIDGSTDLLLRAVASSFTATLASEKKVKVIEQQIRLNDLTGIPCQSCGDVPQDDFCFYVDDISAVYKDLIECDCLLFGTPIHFDSVSAQAKLFIDRCNCFRPPDYDNIDPDHNFLKRLNRKRPGAMILAGGRDAWFEGARRCLAGFFKWVEVTNDGKVTFCSDHYLAKGTVSIAEPVLEEARKLGTDLARKVVLTHDR